MKRSLALWVFIFACAFQISFVVCLETRGAGHFHVTHDATGHGHSHSGVEHHHHHADDHTVVVVEDSMSAVATHARAAKPDTAAVVTVSPEQRFHASRTGGGVAAHAAARLQSQFPRRLERPPRST